jgi:hypothetical protein
MNENRKSLFCLYKSYFSASKNKILIICDQSEKKLQIIETVMEKFKNVLYKNIQHKIVMEKFK